MSSKFLSIISSLAEDVCSAYGSSCTTTIATGSSLSSETTGVFTASTTSLPNITTSLSSSGSFGATLALDPPLVDSSGISATVEEGSSATTVQSDSRPSQASEVTQSATSSSFLQNKDAVGCTFAALALLILLALAGTHLLLKRRRQQRHLRKGLSNLDFLKGVRLSGTTMAESLQDVYASQGKEYDMLDE